MRDRYFEFFGIRGVINQSYFILAFTKKSFIFKRRDVQFFKLLGALSERFLPTFWSVSLYSCDSDNPNCAYSGYYDWAWGTKSIRRMSRFADEASDGPARVTRIGFVNFLKYKNERGER